MFSLLTSTRPYKILLTLIAIPFACTFLFCSPNANAFGWIETLTPLEKRAAVEKIKKPENSQAYQLEANTTSHSRLISTYRSHPNTRYQMPVRIFGQSPVKNTVSNLKNMQAISALPESTECRLVTIANGQPALC